MKAVIHKRESKRFFEGGDADNNWYDSYRRSLKRERQVMWHHSAWLFYHGKKYLNQQNKQTRRSSDMKKILILTLVVMMLLTSSTLLFAQTESKGDTLIVGPFNSQGLPLGALNEAIKGDTTAAGERAHKVYKLQRGAQYILTEVIQGDFPLVIVADAPDASNRPPIIRGGLREDGSAVNLWWQLYDNATFKNLWISGINLDGTGPINWIAQEVNTTGKTILYEGCIVDYTYTWGGTFADWGGMNVYKIINCIFMYIGNPTGTTWNGAICNALHADSMIVLNSTFYDFGCFAVAPGDNGNYFT